MWEIEANGHMTPHVAKFYKTLEDDSVVFEDAKLNMVAESFAHEFNIQSRLPQKVLFVCRTNERIASTECFA